MDIIGLITHLRRQKPEMVQDQNQNQGFRKMRRTETENKSRHISWNVYKQTGRIKTGGGGG